jgi:SnoaL-like polyketide cyclase
MTATKSNNLPLWVQDRDTVIANSSNAEWRYGKPPDYTESKEGLAKESTYNHPEGSLEDLVQNLVRTFELEVSFKTNPTQWLSVVNDQFRMSSNGGKDYKAEDVAVAGTYNLFVTDTEHYKPREETFESSGKLFRTAFPKGFLWEVLEVYSGPPNVTFKWRHWGTFTGEYKGHAATGETVEIIGMSLAKVSEDLKIISVEHYFDNTAFFTKLTSGSKGNNSNSQQTATINSSASFGSSGLWGMIKRIWSWKQQPENVKLQTATCPFRSLVR